MIAGMALAGSQQMATAESNVRLARAWDHATFVVGAFGGSRGTRFRLAFQVVERKTSEHTVSVVIWLTSFVPISVAPGLTV
jgi:hypothetical protein